MGCEEPIACARIGRPTNSQAEANQTKQGGKFECFFFLTFFTCCCWCKLSVCSSFFVVRSTAYDLHVCSCRVRITVHSFVLYMRVNI